MKTFTEYCPMWQGMALEVAIEEKLFDQQSKFQRIEVFKTQTYGNMLVLDGKIQCTERDEWAYHRVLVSPVVKAHPAPKLVLIVGGGDGAALRDVLEDARVELAVLCEIDPMVISVAKTFFPKMSAQLDSDRAQIITEDAIAYLESNPGVFDVIIVDSSDPFGPAEALFESPFYGLIKSALRADGFVAAQSGHFMIHESTVEHLKDAMLAHFKHYHTLFAVVPSYPGGGVNIAYASDSERVLSLENPLGKL